MILPKKDFPTREHCKSCRCKRYHFFRKPERNQGNVLEISGLDKLRLHTIVLKISVLEQFILRSRYTIPRADVVNSADRKDIIKSFRAQKQLHYTIRKCCVDRTQAIRCMSSYHVNVIIAHHCWNTTFFFSFFHSVYSAVHLTVMLWG